MSVALTTAPTGIPITLEEAKAHLRVNHANDDDDIMRLIVAAVDYAQEYTGRQFYTATYTEYLDDWPRVIHLSRRPVSSVTSVKYIDTNGTQQTLDSSKYRIDTVQGRITEAFGETWPSIRDLTNAIEVEYVAGDGDIDDMPAGLHQAVLLMVGHWYENREATTVGAVAREVPMAARALLDQRRFYAV